MIYGFFIASVACFGFASGMAHAAQDLEGAVATIAAEFTAARPPEAPPIRIVVTDFAQDDQRTTLFSRRVLAALEKQLHIDGGGKFRVIERRQLEMALSEINISAQRGLFDPDAAKELGRILSADAIVVGEISSLTERIEINARLVDVETLEVITPASDWVPRTPSVTAQLETAVLIPRVNSGDSGADPRNGVWAGTGQCGDVTFGVTLGVNFTSETSVFAVQTYYPTPTGLQTRASSDQRQGLEPGVLLMEGEYSSADRSIVFKPRNWLHQPPGHSPLGFRVILDESNEKLDGIYLVDGCNSISLGKID